MVDKSGITAVWKFPELLYKDGHPERLDKNETSKKGDFTTQVGSWAYAAKFFFFINLVSYKEL